MNDHVRASAAGVDPRVVVALAPLPDGIPDPDLFRTSPEFEALDTELRKLERDGPAAVAWPSIVRQAQAALAGQAKDLSVACWLTLALANTEGLGGLATGLEILRGLVDLWWDGAAPTRPRARAAAFDWLATRAGRLIPAETPPGGDQYVTRAFDAADALDRMLANKLPDNSVSLGELLRPLRPLALNAQAEATRHADTEKQAQEPPAQSVPPTAPPPPRPSALAAPAAVAVTPGNPDRTFSALHDTVRTTAMALMEADPTEWRAYQLLRSVTWLAVTELPPVQGGRTALMPPSPTRLAEFDGLSKAGNTLALVLAVERFCSASGLFWLDGQRLSAMALATMGPRYTACSREVATGTLALLQRLPALETMAFSEGTPFADGATRAWLETPRLAATESTAPARDAAPWTEGFAEARRVALGGEADAALAALAHSAAAAPDRRSRMFWRLAQARLCLETDVPLVALALLRALDREADLHGLEEWEPAAAAEIGSLLYQCAASPAMAEKIADAGREANKAFARAARSDPVAAVRALRVSPS